MLFLSYLLLGIALLVDDSLKSLPLLLASAGLVAVGLWRPSRVARSILGGVVAASALLSLAESPTMSGELRGVLSAALLSLGAGVLVCFWRPSLAGNTAFAVALAVYAAAGAAVITRTPAPRIDVYELQQEGAKALESRLNPYALSFPNPYSIDETRTFFGDERAELHEYPYPPLSLISTTAGHLLGRDARWALLGAQIGIAAILFALARGAGHEPPVALAIGVLHLLQLRGLQMLDMAWTDSMPALAFLAVVLLAQRRARGFGSVLGMFVAFKQYSVLALPLVARCGRVSPRAWFEALATAAVVTLPFVLWSPRDFVDDVVLFQLRQPFRMDALSIPACIAKATAWRAPGALALAGWGAALAGVWRRVGSCNAPSALPLATASVYMGFFLCAKQAFCNYYYLVGVLILGGAALLEPPTPRVSPHD